MKTVVVSIPFQRKGNSLVEKQNMSTYDMSFHDEFIRLNIGPICDTWTVKIQNLKMDYQLKVLGHY